METSLPLFIMLMSNEHEKVQMAAMTASVAAVSERPVAMFISMNAVSIFRRDAGSDALRGEEFSTLMHQKGVPSPVTLLEQGKLLGELKVYACSMALDVSGTALDELADVFDDTVGLTKFLSDAEHGQIVTF